LVAAAPALDPEELVRRGNAAFEREDYPTALELYAQAEEKTTDPGLIAFNEATALYRLAAEPGSAVRRASLFREAELHYRRALEDASGARRTKALFGLGNSLLQQGPVRGADALGEAVRAYQQCLAEEPGQLADDARHNLELAKLLWLQARSAKKDPNKGQTEDEDDPLKRQPPQRQPADADTGNQDGNIGGPGASGDKVPARLLPGQQPLQTEERRPGEGNLPPVPDKEDLVAMPPEDAAAHLERATARILHEDRAHQQQLAKPPTGNVKDW
jgi:tetratricopeptide (TPR) repeat protein